MNRDIVLPQSAGRAHLYPIYQAGKRRFVTRVNIGVDFIGEFFSGYSSHSIANNYIWT